MLHKYSSQQHSQHDRYTHIQSTARKLAVWNPSKRPRQHLLRYGPACKSRCHIQKTHFRSFFFCIRFSFCISKFQNTLKKRVIEKKNATENVKKFPLRFFLFTRAKNRWACIPYVLVFPFSHWSNEMENSWSAFERNAQCACSLHPENVLLLFRVFRKQSVYVYLITLFEGRMGRTSCCVQRFFHPEVRRHVSLVPLVSRKQWKFSKIWKTTSWFRQWDYALMRSCPSYSQSEFLQFRPMLTALALEHVPSGSSFKSIFLAQLVSSIFVNRRCTVLFGITFTFFWTSPKFASIFQWTLKSMSFHFLFNIRN